MAAVRSLRRIPVFVWVPPIFSPVSLIEIEQTDGTKHDVTDRLLSGEYTFGITETIGNFNFTIDNSDQFFTEILGAYDKLNVYLDYATSATTLRFQGFLEKVSKQKEQLKLSGRSTAVRVIGITVTGTFTNQFTNVILKSLLDKYATFITQTNIDTTESTDTKVTVTWHNKPFWEAVQDLANRAVYDAFIDQNLDFHYFVTDTRNNTTEAVVHQFNLIETGEFSPDASVVRNRVIVFGAEIEGQQIIWTSEDTDSQNIFDVKELIIKDTSIRTPSQAEERADYELSLGKDPPIVGEVISLGLPTLAPGEKTRISDPLNNLDPQFYAIQKFTHQFSNDEPMKTILTVQKETSTIPKILKKLIQFEVESPEKTNPNEMRFSILYTYDDDIGTHTNTEITDGVLKTTGGASGTWISNTNTTPNSATAAELRVSGSTLAGTDYFVSADGGSTFQSVTPETSLNLSPPGSSLVVKVELNSATTEIEALSLLYKT